MTDLEFVQMREQVEKAIDAREVVRWAEYDARFAAFEKRLALLEAKQGVGPTKLRMGP